jgi:hypothetical protein
MGYKIKKKKKKIIEQASTTYCRQASLIESLRFNVNAKNLVQEAPEITFFHSFTYDFMYIFGTLRVVKCLMVGSLSPPLPPSFSSPLPPADSFFGNVCIACACLNHCILCQAAGIAYAKSLATTLTC